jgi:hypothetical protein
VIRNVVLHAANEQPLLMDIYSLPTSSDAGLLCTNLRMMDGKRPVFIDDIAGTFFFPYHVVRFLEIPPTEMARHLAEGGTAPSFSAPSPTPLPASSDERLPAVVGGPDDGAGVTALDDLEIEIDLDEDFLQRVRDA